MRYIDAEKLVAGLKHLQEKFEFLTYEAIYHLINSLQQEQPHFADASKMEWLNVDIEEEITRTYYDGSVADTSDMDHITYENIARHFFELGRNERMEK